MKTKYLISGAVEVLYENRTVPLAETFRSELDAYLPLYMAGCL